MKYEKSFNSKKCALSPEELSQKDVMREVFFA